MSWIESHDTLARHPKTKRLMRALNIGRAQAIGHLHLLWWWTLEFAQDGNLSRFAADELADAAEWEGDPDTFLGALVTAGFVDAPAAGQQTVHDWQEYAGRLVAQREHNAAKQRAWRARQQGDVTPPPAPTTPPPSTHDGDVTARDISPNSYVTVTSPSRNGATVPNRTVPDQTIPNLETIPPTPQPEPALTGAQRGAKLVKLTGKQQSAFDALWAKYPTRNGSKGPKQEAATVFSQIAEADWPDLALALTNYRAVCSGPNGRLPKDACRFLRDGYWRDYVDIDPTPETESSTALATTGGPYARPTHADREAARLRANLALIHQTASSDASPGPESLPVRRIASA